MCNNIWDKVKSTTTTLINDWGHNQELKTEVFHNILLADLTSLIMPPQFQPKPPTQEKDENEDDEC